MLGSSIPLALGYDELVVYLFIPGLDLQHIGFDLNGPKASLGFNTCYRQQVSGTATVMLPLEVISSYRPF